MKRTRKLPKASKKALLPVLAPKRARAGVRAITHATISLRAYEIYLQEGRPDGRAADHWARAESELRARA
jgi:hypothetical protein